MPTLYSIQYLRALAALAVVVFHAGERSGLHFMIGAAGVDVFFVVSGFIMVAISDGRPTSPAGFFSNRLLRIAPTYWIATAAMIAGAALGLFPNLQLSLAHTLGSFLFLPVRSPSNGELWPVLVQGWTLNYEIFFYAVFALTLTAPRSMRVAVLAVVFGLLVLAGMLLQPENPFIGFYTSPSILEFVAGAALARAWRADRLPSATVGMLLALAGLAGFAAIQILGLEFGPWSCGPLAVLLVTGTLTIETRGRLPKWPALTYVGDSSYSIYLWHTFAVSVAVKLAGYVGLVGGAALALAVIAGALLGILAYEGLERPLNMLFKGKGRQKPLFRLPLRREAR